MSGNGGEETSPEELEPSDLGTKSYWEEIYERELSNYQSHGDVGEIWFGEESLLRILSWMEKEEVPKDKGIIDLGCGNGMTLIELARKGYTDLTGVDYSERAIHLATKIAQQQDLNIKFSVADITSDSVDLGRQFEIALDKGTFDAVSLNPEDAPGKRAAFIRGLDRLLSPNGLFLITSCNWTQEELKSHFKPLFHVVSVIPTPTFKFGGKVGNLLSVVVMAKGAPPQ